MCSPNEILSILIFLAFIAAAIQTARLHLAFARTLKSDYPLVWADISTAHRLSENSSFYESAVTAYIFQRGFDALPQESLVNMGERCRWWYFASIAAFAACGVHGYLLDIGFAVECLWRV
jgi:hypothetical protein